MKTHHFCLLAAVSAFAMSNAWGQTVPGQASATRGEPAISHSRNGNAATQEPGTILKKDIRGNSKIPLNKTYGELTPEQRAELHAQYEALPEGDEPPFPENGIKPIFSAIRKAQRIRQARGELI